MFKNELIQASANGEIYKVQDILKSNKQININDYNSNNGNTALHYAASNGYLDICKELINAGARIEQTDNATQTPLFKASLAGHPLVVEYLISKGGNVNRQNKLYETPLYALCESLSKLSESHIPNGSDGISSLSSNSSIECKQKISTVQVLLKSNANIEIASNSGKTPLMLASRSQIPELVQLLIDHNGNPSKKDNLGLDSFEYSNNNQTILKILKKELKYTSPSSSSSSSSSSTSSTLNPQCSSCNVKLSVLAKYCSTCGIKV